jgi:hypothetical protein
MKGPLSREVNVHSKAFFGSPLSKKSLVGSPSWQLPLGAAVIPLLRAIDTVFVAALRFYRGKRGSGQKAIDVSTFFQRRNLHKEFGKYWRGAGNKSRRGFRRAWTTFRKALDDEMAG